MDICIDCDGSGRYPSGAECKSCCGAKRVLPGDVYARPMTEQEKADLQVWLRHGRIGIGRSYQEEVARAYRLDGAAASNGE
jgi:hypothetical protein